jgi:hypothetical protein
MIKLRYDSFPFLIMPGMTPDCMSAAAVTRSVVCMKKERVRVVCRSGRRKPVTLDVNRLPKKKLLIATSAWSHMRGCPAGC